LIEEQISTPVIFPFIVMHPENIFTPHDTHGFIVDV